MIKLHPSRLLAMTALLFASVSANAALTVYTSEASFLAATSNRGVDTYASLPLDMEIASGLVRSAGAYNYTILSSPFGVYSAGTAANPSLTTFAANATVTLTDFGAGTHAIGGNFYGTNVAGAFNSGTVRLTATDADGALIETIFNASTSSFLGFISTDVILSLGLSALDRGLYVTADNLVIGQRVEPLEAVPEPGSIALLLGGLGIMGALARRRKA